MAHRPARSASEVLPLRFETLMTSSRYGDNTSVEAKVYIDQTRVVMQRPLAGLPVILAVPIRSVKGVAVEITPGESAGSLKARLLLLHGDPAMCVTLKEGDSAEALADDWQMWGDELGLSLLLIQPDGTVQCVRQNGPQDLTQAEALPRRKIAGLTQRRPRFLVRRKPGQAAASVSVHRGEHEIIARH